MKVEITETGMLSQNLYNAEFYEKSGLFMVKDELSISSFLLVNKTNNNVWFICQKEDMPDFKLIEEKVVNEEKVVGGVSEDLFLKSLSLLVNKDESYKQ